MKANDFSNIKDKKQNIQRLHSPASFVLLIERHIQVGGFSLEKARTGTRYKCLGKIQCLGFLTDLPLELHLLLSLLTFSFVFFANKVALLWKMLKEIN